MKETIDKNFYGAMKASEAEQLIANKLYEEGFTKHNTLFADSSCPDEINHDDSEQDLTLLFFKRWGEIFPLSGLAGIPFVGKSGWNAFATHVPTDGNIVVLFAPHVGIDKNGNIGELTRNG